MEYFDILDSSATPLGRIKPRRDVHRDGDWHRTVHIWVVNSSGDFLLQKRSAAKESHPGKWDISAAGHIEAGSTSIDAAIRELREEIGICVTASDLRFLFTVKGEYHDPVSGFLDREYSDVYLHRTTLDIKDMSIQPEEVESIRFVSSGRLIDMVDRHDPQLVPHNEELKKVFELLVAKPSLFEYDKE